MTAWFDKLYKEYYRSVCVYFSRRYKDDEAEDLAQETFMRLWAWSGCGDSIKNEKSLVFSVAKSVLCDRLRQRDLLAQSEQIEEILNLASSQSVEQTVEAAQLMSSLNDEERMLVELKGMGYKSAEIGEKLGISASAARTRLQQVRKKLRDLF